MLKLKTGRKKLRSFKVGKRIAEIQKAVKLATKIKIQTLTHIGEDMDLKCVPTHWQAMDDWLTGTVEKLTTTPGSGRGVPCGRIVEVLGPESTCKTTLTLQLIADYQNQGLVCAFIDAEHALDPKYAVALGVDLDSLLINQPDSAEQALDLVVALAESGVDLIVVDSVAALTPEKEREGSVGKAQMGLQARLMSQTLRKLTSIASKSGSTVVFINQVRMKIGVYFGNPEVGSGGNALKFYSSLRIELRRVKLIKKGVKAVGTIIRAKTIKNKVAQPFREVELHLRFGKGIIDVKQPAKKSE